MALHEKEAPDQIKLSGKESEELKKRIQQSNLSGQDLTIVLGLISFSAWLQESLGKAKLTIKRLNKLFGFKSEAKKKTQSGGKEVSNNPNINKSNVMPEKEGDASLQSPQTNSNESQTTKEVNWNPKENHGCYGANDYTGCPVTNFYFEDELLKKGKCPDCAECNTDSLVTPVKPKVLIFLKSQPLVAGDRYLFEKVRCTTCQTYFTAPIPEALNEQDKYNDSCKTSIAISHYYSGLPFKRIETLQALQGVPLADSTQYDLMKQLYVVIQPVAAVLRQFGANGASFFFDDTPGRILDQINENKKADSNKDKHAIHTTALLSEYQGNRIYLFNTNKQTAGKEFKALLKDRQSDEEFISMSDASPHNFPELEDHLLAKWIISLCLSHSRRKFVELLDGTNEDIQLVLDIIAEVYHNEKYCKKKNLNDQQRLTYHQIHSKPRLLALKIWLNNLMLYKQVEPNSCLGQAITYLLKRWRWLTQFLHVPGASLDNNICEQAIKVVIRYRKNSLFYKSFYGATIGDTMMSVLHTAAAARVNIFNYLNALQKYTNEVNASPENWLPWNYKEAINLLNQTKPRILNSA